jgi:hypothetical protein
MFSIVCCLGCVSLVGGRNYLVRKLAFFPPKPPGYKINSEGELLVINESKEYVRVVDVLPVQRGANAVQVKPFSIKTPSGEPVRNEEDSVSQNCAGLRKRQRTVQVVFFQHASSKQGFIASS